MKPSNPATTTLSRRKQITEGVISTVLFRLTMPMMIAIVAIMGLGVIDSYFVAYLGTNELAAIGFTAPIAAMVTSFALGLGMGISSLTSRLIGEEREQSAARLITDGFYLTLLVSALTIALLYLGQTLIFRWLGADEEVLPVIALYMQWWIPCIPFLMITLVSSSTLRALGDTANAAKIAISMALFNLILDPILIFGFGPIPAMGISGAALATTLAGILACIHAVHRLGWVEKVLISALPTRDEFWANQNALMSIAVPAVLANSIVPLIATLLTVIVAVMGTAAVAGFGVSTRIEALCLIVVYALSSTLPMFIGQNLGAQKLSRVRDAITLCFRFTLVWQLVVALILLLTAKHIAAIFTSDPAVANIIIWFLWLTPLSHGFAGNVILINVAMNVLGKPKLALYINLARLLVLTVPPAYLGLYLAGVQGLFLAIVFGNLVAYFIAKVLLDRTLSELNILPVRVLSSHSSSA
ncbi:MAG: MATE family efflux transporter [Pseudomonadota bacterium]